MLSCGVELIAFFWFIIVYSCCSVAIDFLSYMHINVGSLYIIDIY